MDFSKIDNLFRQMPIDDGALEEAEHGNTKRLARKLRADYKLSDKERHFVANFLEGKRRFKRGKASVPFYLDAYVLEALVYRTEYLGDKVGIAKEEIAKQIGETVKSVNNRIKRAQNSKYYGAELFSQVMKLKILAWRDSPHKYIEELGELKPWLDCMPKENLEYFKTCAMKKKI